MKHGNDRQHVVPDPLSSVRSENLEDIDNLHVHKCFLEELADTIEIDLTLRDRLQTKLKQLPDIAIRDSFIYKRTEYASGDSKAKFVDIVGSIRSYSCFNQTYS